MKKFWNSWYVRQRLVWALGLCILPGVLALWIPILLLVAKMAVLAVVVGALVETFLLFRKGVRVEATREMDERLSNGDDNTVHICIDTAASHVLHATIIDELPARFQMRDVEFDAVLVPGLKSTVTYIIHPTERGVYAFGALIIYVRTFLGFVERRYRCEASREIAVYPSVINMLRTQMIAFSNMSARMGLRKLQRIGHTMEFEKIKQYVAGDDVRTLNWRATARTSTLMVNQYRDERSQDVYSILDMGRVMQMPFEGMTLLDHSINAALAFSNVVLRKEDRAGLITYGHKAGRTVAAGSRAGQLAAINDVLYRADTGYLESDDAHMLRMVSGTARQRSLLMLYTNIESMPALRRRMPTLQLLARKHVLVVVLFVNTELKTLMDTEPHALEGVYVHTIARTFDMQKREIVAALRSHGIYAVLTPPKELSLATINLYLELKSRGVV